MIIIIILIVIMLTTGRALLLIKLLRKRSIFIFVRAISLLNTPFYIFSSFSLLLILSHPPPNLLNYLGILFKISLVVEIY